MPTYEYQCRKCGHRFEVFQRIVDPPVRDCPKCRTKGSVEQIISGGAGLIFKGSGFYETDYRRKPGAAEPAPDSPKSEPAGEKSASTDKKKPPQTSPAS